MVELQAEDLGVKVGETGDKSAAYAKSPMMGGRPGLSADCALATLPLRAAHERRHHQLAQPT